MKPVNNGSAPYDDAPTDALAYRPVRNGDVRAERMESGDLLLTYPVTLRPWLDRLYKRLGRGARQPLQRKVQLDALGTQVWGLIDGHRSVADIVAAFGEAHQLPRREAELSVTAFLRMLGKRGLVGMQTPASGASIEP